MVCACVYACVYIDSVDVCISAFVYHVHMCEYVVFMYGCVLRVYML